MQTRRAFLQASGAVLATAALAPTLSPIRGHAAPRLAPGADAGFAALLGTSLREEHDYRGRVEGTVPDGLRGTLYRNGPGLFERAGHRKNTLLDGDGMLQAFTFDGSGVRYRNRFVRTEKFVEEEGAGRFLEPTWTTLAPRWYQNLPGFPTRSQAGVTVYMHEGRLFAIDEVGPLHELDPDTLELRGTVHPDPVRAASSYKAHTKIDGRSGDWVLMGWSSGRETSIDTIVRAGDGSIRTHLKTPVPRGGYIHDFFATERYVVAVLPAVDFHPFGMLAGRRSVWESLEWKPEIGNLALVIDKSGDGEPLVLEAPPAWMWHAFNAYEKGDSIVADFVGFDAPDHFIGEDPALAAIMQGRRGQASAPGTLRRYVIEPKARRLREETVVSGNHEFPMVHPQNACHEHRYGYACIANAGSFLHDGVRRVDFENGSTESFRFGPDVHVGEPVFAPRSRTSAASRGSAEPGWLLSLCLDGSSQRSFLAILDAEALPQGPIARIWLEHHTPLSFHGYWRAA